ncbi:MAG TPA: hypothetical protein VN112_22065 [Ensifer sp.]|nr:hypothetical protein [Ensifer sp.]
MPSEAPDRQPQPRAIRLAIALLLLLALSGLAMIGNGFYILAKAEFSNTPISGDTSHHLAHSSCGLAVCPDDAERG